jgi:quercetin dioxygenase-like cupin family protein
VTPAQSTLQIDNARVRITEWRFAPDTETGWHVHQFDYVVVPLYDGTLHIETSSGITEVGLRRGESYTRAAGVEHNVISRNPGEFAFVEIELKD